MVTVRLFASPFVAQIAAQAPSTVEEFDALSISGLSTYLKRQLARHVVAAVKQADAFLELVQQGAMQLGDFQLDTTNMFAAVGAVSLMV